jgi:hypothetical protein
VAEHASRIGPIIFVCREAASFLSCDHALKITVRGSPTEAPGADDMFIHRNSGRHAPAVSLGILTVPQASFVVRNLSAMQTHHTSSARMSATAAPTAAQ